MIWLFLILASERCLGVFGRTRDLPPGTTPYEGSVLQRNPRQRLKAVREVLTRSHIVPGFRSRRMSNMAKPATLVLGRGNRALSWVEQAAIVISASLFVALCARVTLPLPFTPVPLTLQNFGVLLVGLTLGSRRGFAALALYLIEGASGIPVFQSCRAGRRRSTPGRDWWISAGLPVRCRSGGLDHGTWQGKFSRAPAPRACWLRWCCLPVGTFLACRADSFLRAGCALRAVLVRVRRNHQGDVGGRGLNRLAIFPQGAGMSLVG